MPAAGAHLLILAATLLDLVAAQLREAAFSYEGDLTDPLVLERLGKGSACGTATVKNVNRWPGAK